MAEYINEYIDTNTKIRVWDIGEDGAPHFVNTTVARFLLAHLDTTGLINGMPIADVQPIVQGEWIKDDDGVCWWWKCSVCGERPLQKYKTDVLSDFCPNCGARMEG